jgi:[protein-PII] uridylyltransferase
MPAGTGLSAAVIAAKEQLALGRDKLRRQHDSGSPGVQVCTHFTELLEEIVLELFHDAADNEKLASKVALVAHSGFGRREMAPYSDLDLMLLHPFKSDEEMVPLVRPFKYHLIDLGLEVGFAPRTINQACDLALGDATIFTAQSEGRLLYGDAELYEQFDARFRRLTQRNWRKLVPLVEEARKAERTKYGETNFLLEPNVKRSRGALRDLQLVRWIGFARYGESEPDGLMQSGHLTREDLRRLRKAREFLLQLRNELHFQAGKASDLLDRAEQLRIAERHGYSRMGKERAEMLPVERFMRDYFQHTTAVREIASHFAEGARPRAMLRRFLEPLLSRQVEKDFRVGPTEISVVAKARPKLQGDLVEVLRLLVLANQHDRRIEHETWEAIRSTMDSRPLPDPNEPLPQPVAERFLSLLSEPAQLSELLRRLHNLHVLEQIVPGMGHTRGLLQFNAYHHYTVDEHSLRAVQCVAEFAGDKGLAGQVYRSLKTKRTLHLAVLIHDLGKGFVRDHSEVGAEMAAQLGHRLHLPEREADQLKFLVLKHLRMSHLAQQHDIHDESVVVQFAVEVGSAENLQMLYLLTLADLAAVGPGVLNEWKQELLSDLYAHTLHLLASDSPADASNQRMVDRREEMLTLVRSRAAADPQPLWWERQIAALPGNCLFAVPPQQMVAELEKLRTLPHQEAVSWGRFLPQRNVVEYTVGTYEEITPGIFHKLTGALSSHRQQILSAEINTLPEGLVLDRFYVRDSDYSGPPPDERIAKIGQSLVAALKDQSGRSPTFTHRFQDLQQTKNTAINHLPTRVNIDNSTSDSFTILALFAYDRLGLLYTITRTLFELGLSVSRSKIGTHLDQVVDVFYVTDHSGQKITDEVRLEEIRSRLLRAIEAE